MNHLLLQAVVVEQGPMRWTPAGLPALDLLLDHEGVATEGGATREVKLQMKAVAFGDVAHALASRPLGRAAVFTGFLAAAAKGPRGTPRGLKLHVTAVTDAPPAVD